MKELASSESRSFAKTLRLIVAGALVLTMFNCSLMAYADTEADPTDVDTPVVESVEGSQDVAASNSGSDFVAQTVEKAAEEFKAMSADHGEDYSIHNTFTDRTYVGIHLGYDGNADGVTNVPEEAESDSYLLEEQEIFTPCEDREGYWNEYYINSDGELIEQKIDSNGEVVSEEVYLDSIYEYLDSFDNISAKQEETDEDGNVVVKRYIDENGDIIVCNAKYETDDDGNKILVRDEDGNIVYIESREWTRVGDNYVSIRTPHIFTVSDQTPVRDGYNFVEWNTKSDGSGDSYKPGDSFVSYFCSTLYAIWEAIFGGGEPEQGTTPENTEDPDNPDNPDNPIIPIVPSTTTPQGPTTPTGGNGGTPTSGVSGSGAPISPIEMSAIDENGNPLGVFDAGHGYGCWVHWWILLGMLITCGMTVLVLNRRERFISKLNRIEDDILDNRVSVPAGNADPSFVPVGATA